MTLVRLVRLMILVAVLSSVSACTRRGPDLAKLAPDDLYGRATAAYEAEEYDDAIRLLEAFVQQHVADPRVPEALLVLARAHQHEEEYISAISYFQRLLNSYPASQLGLDARFGICSSYYELSPQPALDQEYTRSALLHCASVAENFGGTAQAEEAARYTVELRRKLARKSYDTALFYLKRNAYDAAVVYLTEVVDRYPQTKLAPEALRRLAETYEQIGYVEEAEEARERLLREYPESPQAQALRV